MINILFDLMENKANEELQQINGQKTAISNLEKKVIN